MFERWNEKVRDVDGIGVTINYKYDEKIFRRYTRNAQSRTLLAYNQTYADLGLQVSTQKCVCVCVKSLISNLYDKCIIMTFHLVHISTSECINHVTT